MFKTLGTFKLAKKKKKKQFSRFDVSFDELYMEGRLDEPIPPVEMWSLCFPAVLRRVFCSPIERRWWHRSVWISMTMVNE